MLDELGVTLKYLFHTSLFFIKFGFPENSLFSPVMFREMVRVPLLLYNRLCCYTLSYIVFKSRNETI